MLFFTYIDQVKQLTVKTIVPRNSAISSRKSKFLTFKLLFSEFLNLVRRSIVTLLF